MWTGQNLVIERSDGELMALLNAGDSKDTVILQGLGGDVYTIKLGDSSPVRHGLCDAARCRRPGGS